MKLAHDLLQQSQKLCLYARWVVYMWVLVWMFCVLSTQEKYDRLGWGRGGGGGGGGVGT